MSNYRPISILTPFSEVLEKLLYIRLSEHITKNNILANEQFGFRAESSTVKATYKLLDEILTTMNSKALVGDIFCDLSKSQNFTPKTEVLWYCTKDSFADRILFKYAISKGCPS
jgi:hypothetical protein